MNPATLAAALATQHPPLVLDVRLADDFEDHHIPDAVNNPVFEFAFGPRLLERAPDLARPVVVCGADGAGMEAAMAAEKLVRAGYRAVDVLAGGIAAWRAAGQPVITGAPVPPPPAPVDGLVDLDLAESRVEWLGRNLLNKHWGTVGIHSGHLRFAAGRLVGGEVVLDLRRITCTDLAGSHLHDLLIAHLHDHDFFDVARFPNACLAITRAEPLAGASPGVPNLGITAELTFKDHTEQIRFDAVSGLTPAGKPAAQAVFAIDRTRWGVLYGSGKFFHRLAGHLVNDLIEFQVRIVGA